MKQLNLFVLLILLVYQSFGQVNIPAIIGEIKMSDNGIETVFPVKTLITFNTMGDKMDVKAKINISFQNFQKNQNQILKKAVEEHDECGERLKLTKSNLSERGGLAFLSANLTYERWMCALGGKTRLVRQSGSIKVKITPEVENSTLYLRTQVVDIDADGALGSLLGNNDFKEKVIRVIGLDDRLEAALPKEFSSLDPEFGSFKFSTIEDVIYLNAEANMLLSGTQLALLMTLGQND